MVVFMVRPQILLPALVPKYGVPLLTAFLSDAIKLFLCNWLARTKVLPPPVNMPSAFSIASEGFLYVCSPTTFMPIFANAFFAT